MNNIHSDINPIEKPVAGMFGSCTQMTELFRRIRKVAQTSSSVMIYGETGTGKELVARALHEGSSRNHANFVSINCAAIPEDLIESELFGHEKGAFNGATSDRIGLIEEARNGTIFLDEIGELSLDAQARLLRVLQEHEIRKVGSVESTKVDIRLIAATHRDLNQLVKEGQFREDLFYRINVMSLQIPPLRDRSHDILNLAEKVLHRICKRLGTQDMSFSPEAIKAITTYQWPGNVRELQNAIERAVILSESNEILLELMGIETEPVATRLQDDSPNLQELPTSDDAGDTKSSSLKSYFQRFVLENQGHMNETELAKTLGISRKCLWERRQRFDIPRHKK
jgi:DNA-binding NtrC family response regulator